MPPKQHACHTQALLLQPTALNHALAARTACPRLPQGLPSFEHDRAKTDRESTTMLSPWIHAGSISVRHVYYRVAQVGARGVGVRGRRWLGAVEWG